jgi:chemotaxis regulatin CheY-phosphate phosphatase CheZ
MTMICPYVGRISYEWNDFMSNNILADRFRELDKRNHRLFLL